MQKNLRSFLPRQVIQLGRLGIVVFESSKLSAAAPQNKWLQIPEHETITESTRGGWIATVYAHTYGLAAELEEQR